MKPKAPCRHIHPFRLCCLAGLLFLLACSFARPSAAAVRVLVWDEQQPAQKQAYENFLGNEIAAFLRRQPGLTVSSARLDDPEQGLSARALDGCDVLIWWGHQRQGEISDEKANDIMVRIRSGRLSLVALHSAHWSQPFVAAMRERARQDALAALSPAERAGARLVETNLFANFRTPPKYDSPRTPSAIFRKPLEGPVEVRLVLPNCSVFKNPNVLRILENAVRWMAAAP